MRFRFIFSRYSVLADMDVLLTWSMLIYYQRMCLCCFYPGCWHYSWKGNWTLWFSLKTLIFALPYSTSWNNKFFLAFPFFFFFTKQKPSRDCLSEACSHTCVSGCLEADLSWLLVCYSCTYCFLCIHFTCYLCCQKRSDTEVIMTSLLKRH